MLDPRIVKWQQTFPIVQQASALVQRSIYERYGIITIDLAKASYRLFRQEPETVQRLYRAHRSMHEAAYDGDLKATQAATARYTQTWEDILAERGQLCRERTQKPPKPPMSGSSRRLRGTWSHCRHSSKSTEGGQKEASIGAMSETWHT